MKNLNFMLLMMLIIVFSFGCADNPSDPEGIQSDQVATSLSKVERFTGTSNLDFSSPTPGVSYDLPGGRTLTIGKTATWYDVASDPRVTGTAYWTVNQKINKKGSGQVWGTAEMVVDGGLGKWEMTWNGVISGNPIDGDLYIKGVANGVGVEGEVEGLIAKWWYILDFANNGFMYTSKGFIK